MKPILRLLLVICWLAQSAQAQAQAQGGEAQLMAALSETRSRGCGASPARASALQPSAALDEAARRIGRGQDAMQATRSAGYRAKRVFQAHFSGYDSGPAVAQAMRERYCAALTDPALREGGAHREGNTWWVVLGAPYDVPRLADAPAVAQRVLALTNEARARSRRCGSREFAAAAPLAANALLDRAAQAHAGDMAM